MFAGWSWYQSNEGREQGVQECVQEINQETIDTLLREITWQDEQLEKLREQNEAIAMLVRNATERRLFAEEQLDKLTRSIEEQREEDEEYREWADTDLPAGVADRLRQAARSQADSND
jgi:predicted RNase H-like nuclease (RuvC/YqgF family)